MRAAAKRTYRALVANDGFLGRGESTRLTLLAHRSCFDSRVGSRVTQLTERAAAGVGISTTHTVGAHGRALSSREGTFDTGHTLGGTQTQTELADPALRAQSALGVVGGVGILAGFTQQTHSLTFRWHVSA